jgi:hypothetical protein
MRRINLRRIGLAAAALVLVALAGLTAVRVHGSMTLDDAAARFEEAVGPLDFEAYRPPPVPDRENAALPILEAVERLEEGPGDDSWREEMGALKQSNRLAARDWSAGDVARARELVASRPGVLALLHRAAGRSGSSYRLDYAAGPEMEIPNLLLHLQAADLLFAEARLAWLDGRREDAVRSVEALAALRRALETEAPLIFQLIGQAVEVLQYRAIQDGLAVGGLGPEALRRLRATTEGTARSELLRRSVGAEGSMVYSVREGGPYAETFAQTQGYYGRLQHRWLADGWLGAGLDYYSSVAEAFPSVPYAEMLDHPALLRRPPTYRAPLVVDLRSSLGTFQGTEALARLARLALDLALAGAETGSLPEELPVTPEAGPGPFTGIPPVYERFMNGSATLSITGAEELWWSLKPGQVGRDQEAPPFTWRLAPPAS